MLSTEPSRTSGASGGPFCLVAMTCTLRGEGARHSCWALCWFPLVSGFSNSPCMQGCKRRPGGRGRCRCFARGLCSCTGSSFCLHPGAGFPALHLLCPGSFSRSQGALRVGLDVVSWAVSGFKHAPPSGSPLLSSAAGGRSETLPTSSQGARLLTQVTQVKSRLLKNSVFRTEKWFPA